ncbi:MAG: GNAT family N-acetyltransferase [Solirubrobacteraceae bacterium]
MIVRKARIEDAEVVALIMAAVAEEDVLGTEPPVDIDARGAQFRETIDGHGRAVLWMLEQNAKAVGYAGVQGRAPGVLSLAMAIVPESRGRGGGRALVETIVEHARSSGAHKIELEVWIDNARAIALYASEGFEVEGLRRNHYRRRDGRLRSALLMALHLAEVDRLSRAGLD